MSAKPALIISHRCNTVFGAELAATVARLKLPHEVVPLPADKEARLPEADVARGEIAFFSQDLNPDFSRQFFSAVRKGPCIKWVHVFNVGVDHPIYTEMLERGVRVTTSAGTTGKPIAQTALTGMLMLSRGFPHWIKSQTEKRWAPVRLQDSPPDLPGQTVVIYGMGSIGAEFARLAKALGMHVIGVRRSPRKADDPVDEMHTPDQIDKLLPRAQWLMLCSPLTAETRKLMSAQRLALLPKGAYVLNVSRGEVIDEPAMIEVAQQRPSRRRVSRRVRKRTAAHGIAAVGHAQRDRHAAQLHQLQQQRAARVRLLHTNPRTVGQARRR